MLEVRDLRLIQAVAEHGTLVRAARVLGISQPALTRSLAAVEAKLRGPLFERSRQGVIATNLGRAVLAEASDILDRLERLDSRISEVRGGQVEELRIVSGNYVGESIGFLAAARMLSRCPRTRLRLIPGDWVEVPRAVHGREASLGLLDLRGHEEDAALAVERLRPQPGVFVVRRDHPLTRLASVSLVDILAYPLMLIGRVPQAFQGPLTEAREAARAAGSLHAAFPAMIQESPSAAVSLLRHCDAVVPVTLQVAGASLRAGEVVPLRWRAPWMSLHPGVVRLRGRPLSESEQTFLEVLRAADLAIERENHAWLSELGLSTDCA